jgi:hypothetical protein
MIRRCLTTALILQRCCSDDARLVKTNLAGRVVFSLEPGGAHVPRRQAVKAIESRKLQPQHDGLFADLSQSWIGSDEPPESPDPRSLT